MKILAEIIRRIGDDEVCLPARRNQFFRRREEIEGYKGFFVEPYFARMDLFDDKEGYNSYYIGKRETSI